MKCIFQLLDNEALVKKQDIVGQLDRGLTKNHSPFKSKKLKLNIIVLALFKPFLFSFFLRNLGARETKSHAIKQQSPNLKSSNFV